MTDLERIKKDVVEMDSRANVCWYDTKVLTKAVRLILEELTADRKTESDSEKPNNCEYAENPSGDVWECGCFLDTYCEHQIYDRNPDGTINIVECGYEPTTEDCSTVPTSSKMEQVDKDINVRSKTEPQYDIDKGTIKCDNCSESGSYKCSKCDGEMYFKRLEVEDEPQTNADQHVQRIEYVGNDGRSRCWTCKHFERMHETPISSDGSYYTYVVCTASECRYEPKDEPQTNDLQDWKDRMWAEAIVTEPTISKMEQVDKDDAYFLELMGAVERGEISDAGANQAWYEYINHKDEPQTDCAWK